MNKILIEIEEFIDIIDRLNTFTPKSIMEIGSMDGKDAHYQSDSVWIRKDLYNPAWHL